MAKGFFSRKDLDVMDKVGTIPKCEKCRLYRHCESPKMKATGKGERGILVIGEAPGGEEDNEGSQFVANGKSGRLLRQHLKKLRIDLDRDCRKINAINCRPKKNRTPTPSEIEYCRPMIWNEIQKHKPKVIILLGASALRSVVGHRWKDSLGGIMKWRGRQIPDREFETWLCPTFHPSYLLRCKPDDVAHTLFDQDLKRAVEYADVDFHFYKEERECIEVMYDNLEIMKRLRKIMRCQDGEKNWIAVDYETTGKKPQAKGHEVVSVSVCARSNKAIAFPMTPDLWQAWRLFIRSGNNFIAANIQFEEVWSQFFFNTFVRTFAWDTMLGAHVIDNRRGTKSLDFLAYVNFGMLNYSAEMKPYLESKSNSANSHNNIRKADMTELLEYSAIDALIEKRLAHKQMKELSL